MGIILNMRQHQIERCISIISLMLLILLLSPVSVIYANTLFITIEEQEDTPIIHAEDGTQTISYPIERLQDIDTLYLQLERQRIDRETFEPVLKELGAQIFEPIISLIQSSSEIVFIIPEHFLKLPLDLLYVDDMPLFLQKPVTYSFTKITSQNWQFSNTLSGLIISDKTADPENGTYFLKKLLPSAEYYDSTELNLSRLASIRPKDIILISAHGQISSDLKDYLALGKERISSSHLSRLYPKLIYLDSCQLGISNTFIQDFRNRGAMYYIAPITSNEAGNSSTKTLEFFFKAFQQGATPSMALFLTRKNLYKHFEMADNFGLLLLRAFPFRVYRLN